MVQLPRVSGQCGRPGRPAQLTAQHRSRQDYRKPPCLTGDLLCAEHEGIRPLRHRRITRKLGDGRYHDEEENGGEQHQGTEDEEHHREQLSSAHLQVLGVDEAHACSSPVIPRKTDSSEVRSGLTSLG